MYSVRAETERERRRERESNTALIEPELGWREAGDHAGGGGGVTLQSLRRKRLRATADAGGRGVAAGVVAGGVVNTLRRHKVTRAVAGPL
jgi:hypothetical protein